MGLKTIAYLLTGSVGLLSDAMESVVNLVGALMALAMLIIAARPADNHHSYGHSKAEYFSSGVEGSLILVAAGSIAMAAIQRLISPRHLEQIGIGLAVSVLASLVNFFVALALMRAARRHSSITLQANAHHLLTDVWTSAGVVAAIGLVGLTGWDRLDPIVAILVSANIAYVAIRIMRESVQGLMDVALPEDEINAILNVFKPYEANGIEFHALRTRKAGAKRFVQFHVLVPGNWSVKRGHMTVEAIEVDVAQALPNAAIITHLEPLGDPGLHEEEYADPPASPV